MPKYTISVTIDLTHEIEAETPEHALEIVKGMDEPELFCDSLRYWPFVYRVYDESGAQLIDSQD